MARAISRWLIWRFVRARRIIQAMAFVSILVPIIRIRLTICMSYCNKHIQFVSF